MLGNVPREAPDRLGSESDAGGIGTACEWLHRKGTLSTQHLSGVARRAWHCWPCALCLADVGNPEDGERSRPCGRKRWFPELAISRNVAGAPWYLLGKCGAGGYELSICERVAVHHGGNVGSATPAFDARG